MDTRRAQAATPSPNGTASTSILSLTLKKQAIQTSALTQGYSYLDALADGLGLLGAGNELLIEPSHANDTVFLWESGCMTNGTSNCTSACQNSEEGRNMVWNSPDAMFTLHNCLIRPVLLNAAANGWLVEDSPGLMDRIGIHSNDLQQFKNLSLPRHMKVVNNCVWAMCSLLYGTQAEEKCPLQKVSSAYIYGPSEQPWTPSFLLYSNLCELGGLVPNGDIGGPGIILSCIIQAAIMLAMWLLLSLVPMICSTINACRNRVQNFTSRPLRVRILSGKQSAALLVALQDFQKTQVFFYLALQIGSLLALNNATWLDSPSMSQLASSLVFMVIVATTGMYPIVLGLVVLRKNKGRLDWFRLVVSLACIGVSSAAWHRSFYVKSSQLRQIDYNPVECGGINPIQHCFQPAPISIQDTVTKGSGFSILNQWITAGPLFVVASLTLERFIPVSTWPRPARIPAMAIRVLRITAVLFAEAWLLWGNLNILVGLCVLWVDPNYEGKIWSVGQVIAAGVFIPVFLEWLYVAIYGVEESFNMRLPGDYKVVNADELNTSASPRSPPPPPPTSVSHDVDRLNSTTLSTYELLPSPYDVDRRVAHAPMWSPT